jgi:hypothetical protein
MRTKYDVNYKYEQRHRKLDEHEDEEVIRNVKIIDPLGAPK